MKTQQNWRNNLETPNVCKNRYRLFCTTEVICSTQVTVEGANMPSKVLLHVHRKCTVNQQIQQHYKPALKFLFSFFFYAVLRRVIRNEIWLG